MKAPPLRFIDIIASEIALPDDPTGIPARFLDALVVPSAMADYILYTQTPPSSPELTIKDGALATQSGGLSLWAAQRARWSKPIRAMIRGTEQTLPAELWKRTYSFAPAVDAANAAATSPRLVPGVAQALSFRRALSPAERAGVEAALRALRESARKPGRPIRAEVTDLSWPALHLLTWRTSRAGNADDLTTAAEWAAIDACLGGKPLLIAKNGRRAGG